MKYFVIIERLKLSNGEWTSWHRGWHRKWYEDLKTAETALKDSTFGKESEHFEFKIIELKVVDGTI